MGLREDGMRQHTQVCVGPSTQEVLKKPGLPSEHPGWASSGHGTCGVMDDTEAV